MNGLATQEKVPLLGVVGAMVFAMSSCQSILSQSTRVYDVQFTTNVIVADGINSPGEWEGAATTGGDWNELRQPFGDVDTDNNEFRLLWDHANLYMRWENDFTSWLPANSQTQNPAIIFDQESISIYFDPNTTGEPNNVLDTAVDGYELAFNLYRANNGGTLISTDAARSGVGFFTEAHVDGPFGNQANWGGAGSSSSDGAALQSIVVAQNNQNSGPGAGGFFEMQVPWEVFNADATILAGLTQIETGLYHPLAPNNGDVWFANVGVSNSSTAPNYLPVWNWTPSNFFASHGNQQSPFGHAELRFVGRIPEPSSGLLAGLGMLAWICWRRERRR